MTGGAATTVARPGVGRATSGSGPGAGERGGKYLTFFLGVEEYGLEILKVQEIMGMMDITPVPRTQHYMRGVINLRGKVIPIVDLRLKFEMEAMEQTDETCIIVVQARGVQMGIVVDKVSEVLDIVDGDIQDAPSFGAGVNTDYILGIGKSEAKVRLLLDIEKVLLTHDTVDLLAALGGTQGPGVEAVEAAEAAA